MAKSHTAAPGTYTKNSVRQTMDAPFGRASQGSGNKMTGTFGGGTTDKIKTTVYDDRIAPGKMPKAGGAQGMGGAGTAPSAQGPVRDGTRQY